MTYFMAMYNKQINATVPNYTLDVMIDNAVDRFYQDISWNPNFVYLPWSGWFVRNAAVVFSGRLFANHSEEYPDGILGKTALAYCPKFKLIVVSHSRQGRSQEHLWCIGPRGQYDLYQRK
jgi:hypothetical protein